MDDFEIREIMFDTEELAEYLYVSLVDFGLAPTEDETDLIADLVFDFLSNLGVVEEEFDDE